MTQNSSTEILRGTLDLLILKTLALEAKHGVAIADRIAQLTQNTFVVRPGSLFPALHRLEADGCIAGEWATTPEGRRVKLYRLTASGMKQLDAQQRVWMRITVAMTRVLQAK